MGTVCAAVGHLGESGNRTSREVSVKVQRYGVTNIIVASQ
jgi:hypothetical protein